MDEELDRSVFETPAKNEILILDPQPTHFISYVDENELDIRDELIEPESQTAELWVEDEETLPPPVPGYSAYTPIRRNTYVRGDLWTDESGSEVRLPPRIAEDDRYINNEEMEVNDNRVLKDEITNAETRGNMVHNQESMAFMPPEFWGKAKEADYEEEFHDMEAWRDSRVHWDNDEDMVEAAAVQRLLFVHHMAPELIDETKVLSRTVRNLCKTLRNRTCPDIGTVYPSDIQLPPLPIDDILKTNATRTPFQMAVGISRIMCHHWDCYGYVPCRVHYSAFHRSTRKDPGKQGRGPLYPRFPPPKLTSRQLIAQTRREKYPVCENDCFQTLDGPAAPNDSKKNDEIVVHVDEAELSEDALAELKLNWKQAPDAIPCDMALFGGGLYTCRQAYQMRNKMFPDMVQLESDGSDTDRGKGKKKQRTIERKRLPA
ncbi:hypothetical protein FRC10_008048 [Ceratobasidium sp. 414]|nr:hypothetical protein FRC10_008048 [Ceratobasidium sp. 414]